jgi:hypothetical protein
MTTPCIICEKSVIYQDRLDVEDDLPLAASHIIIMSEERSNFACNEYSAFICDDCLDSLIQSNKVLAHL